MRHKQIHTLFAMTVRKIVRLLVYTVRKIAIQCLHTKTFSTLIKMQKRKKKKRSLKKKTKKLLVDAASKQTVDQYFYTAYTMSPPPLLPCCGELVISNFTELDEKFRVIRSSRQPNRDVTDMMSPTVCPNVLGGHGYS